MSGWRIISEMPVRCWWRPRGGTGRRVAHDVQRQWEHPVQ